MKYERWELVLAYLVGGLAEMDDCWCCRPRAMRMLRMVGTLADDPASPINPEFVNALRELEELP